MKTLPCALAVSLMLVASVMCSHAQENPQQFASLGDFKLESGEVIRDCRIGYRTYGTLNADKSNVVLATTWFGGNSQQLGANFAPNGNIDSSKFYGIAVDALGNGVSSSPSNSKLQPRMKFPQFTMRDMVNSQYQLLTQVLHINHVKAVFGVSLGGMQTFQWMVSYPGFMDKAIPVVGTPRMTPYEILHWQAQIDTIMNDAGWKDGDYTENPARLTLGEEGAMILWTPEGYNRLHTRQQVLDSFAKFKNEPGLDANNNIRTAQAALKLDVSGMFGGSMEKAAATVKAKVLVISATQDHVVIPSEPLAFARLIHADVVELTGDCGHWATVCEDDKVKSAVRNFLDK